MLGQALYKMLPTAGGIIRSFFCFWTLWKSPAEPCYCSVSYPEILSQCQNSFFTCLEKWGFFFSSVSPGARPVGHVVEVLGELRQVHTLLLRLRERLSCPLNTKQGMTLLWRHSDDDDHDAGDKIEWDLLLNPSEQLCQVDQLEKLRVEQCHLLGHLASQLLTNCTFCDFVLINGLCDTTSTDLKLSKLWHWGFRLKLPDLWMWNQFGQWKRCWQSRTSLFVLKNELGPDRMLFLPLAKFSIVDKTNLKARANPKFPCLIKLVMNSVNFSRRLLFKKSTCLVIKISLKFMLLGFC